MEVMSTFSQQSNSTGSVSLTITIPGTFSTLSHLIQSFSGRKLFKLTSFFGSPSSGDKITGISVQDTNGVIPTIQRSVFPYYPIIANWCDSSFSSSNQGISIPTTKPIEFSPPTGGDFVASGLQIIITAQKGNNSQDTLYVNVSSDDGNPLPGSAVI